MIITTISATVRYSQDTGKGAWKVIELGAEASISDREHWKVAQSELYHQLSHQLRQLWNNGNGAALNGQGSAETAIEPIPEPEPTTTTREHWCEEHRAVFTHKNGKDGSTWWSHKAPDGSWCRE